MKKLIVYGVVILLVCSVAAIALVPGQDLVG